MSEYPSIDPADVREGDVVEADYTDRVTGAYKITGPVWAPNPGVNENLHVGGRILSSASAIRLVSRPNPPEPPLRIGDWVRDKDGNEGQFVGMANDALRRYALVTNGLNPSMPDLTRIEPPVGWPVGVPDPDAPGGVQWWHTTHSGGEYLPSNYLGEAIDEWKTWPDLLAAGGIPTPTPFNKESHD